MLDSSDLAKRFQLQPWYIKLYRIFRHYLAIPFRTVRIYLCSDLSFRTSYSLAKGLAQSKMLWYYTMDEVKARLNFVADSFDDGIDEIKDVFSNTESSEDNKK